MCNNFCFQTETVIIVASIVILSYNGSKATLLLMTLTSFL